MARAAYAPHRYPPESLEPGLNESAFYDPSNFAFSNGVHVCELEVDPETGTTEIVAYHAVDDVGTVINSMIVERQIHGGLAQGIGQAQTASSFPPRSWTTPCRAPATCLSSQPKPTKPSPAPQPPRCAYVGLALHFLDAQQAAARDAAQQEAGPCDLDDGY